MSSSFLFGTLQLLLLLLRVESWAFTPLRAPLRQMRVSVAPDWREVHESSQSAAAAVSDALAEELLALEARCDANPDDIRCDIFTESMSSPADLAVTLG